MRLAFAATALLLLGSAVPVTAQEQLLPTLELGDPALSGGAFVPVEAAGVALEVPWTYRAPVPPNAPAEGTFIAWAVTCPIPIMVQTALTEVVVPPGEQQVSGVASFPVTASREAPGLKTERCTVTGVTGGATESFQASDTVDADLTIAFYGNVTFSLPVGSKQGGPQKQVPYEIEVSNRGNTRIVVTFELVEEPSGKWNLLLPEVMLLDTPNSGAGQSTAKAIVTVATPFDNGYNSGSGDFVVRVKTAAADDPDQVGPSTDLPFTTNVKGLYVPAPHVPLLLLALAVAVALRSRRTS